MAQRAAAVTAKRVSKLERLRSQGNWIEATTPDGRTLATFSLPSPELQKEFDATLDAWLKKHLKECGWELLHATRRDHPFHSDLVRERIDALADELFGFDRDMPFSRDFLTAESVEAQRLELMELVDDTQHKRLSFTEHDIDEMVARYDDYLRDPNWWSGMYLDRILNHLPDGPPFPNALPKPVYFKKDAEVVLALHDGMMDFWARI
jgi:hypothetical protein